MGNRSWRWTAAAASAALVAVASIGCSSASDTVSSTGSTAPSAATGATRTPPTNTTIPASERVESTSQTTDSIPPTTYGDPNESVPPVPVTETPTIPATGEDPAMINCGIVYRASGWPTTIPANPTYFSCLEDAFLAGTPARLVDREQTDGEGGAILVTTYDVLGPGSVRVTVDATAAADRPRGITVSMCTAVTADMMAVTTSGCTVVSG